MSIYNSTYYCKYLQSDKYNIDWQIYLTCSGRQTVPPGVSYPIHEEAHPVKYYFIPWEKGRIVDEFSLVYITKGSGYFVSDQQEIQRVKPGTILMIFPGVRHWYAPDFKTGWNEYWMWFRGNYPELLVEKGFFSPEKAVFDVGLNEKIIELFQQVIAGTKNETEIFQPKLGACIINLLALLLEKSKYSRQNSKDIELVENAKFLFKENVSNSIDMHIVAHDLGLCYANFRKVFKTYTGYTPYQYFLNHKIEKSKQLLEDGKSSIKEIAYQMGFESQYYFSRIFKTKTGYPPSSWRNRNEVTL